MSANNFTISPQFRTFIVVGVRVLLRKDGEFQSQHISDSAYLKAKGIHCVIDQDKEARRKNRAY
ncbi:hypothetical protein [Prevotella denticola]|uniref:hypothetical protein n=1 Tax=Prevotella denticola TaxID=28129 RepID=UPI001C5F9284|nr:hypothetical protein [Prevotella denticola]MBW4753415.1 hypothetical protein [Prevotella denticola]